MKVIVPQSLVVVISLCKKLILTGLDMSIPLIEVVAPTPAILLKSKEVVVNLNGIEVNFIPLVFILAFSVPLSERINSAAVVSDANCTDPYAVEVTPNLVWPK